MPSTRFLVRQIDLACNALLRDVEGSLRRGVPASLRSCSRSDHCTSGERAQATDDRNHLPPNAGGGLAQQEAEGRNHKAADDECSRDHYRAHVAAAQRL
jgi:hypothetical protein